MRSFATSASRTSTWNPSDRPDTQSSGERLDRRLVEGAGDDGDRDREGARGLDGDGGDEGARPFLVGAGGKDKDGDVLVLLDQLGDLVGARPLADDHLRLDRRDGAGHVGEAA